MRTPALSEACRSQRPLLEGATRLHRRAASLRRHPKATVREPNAVRRRSQLNRGDDPVRRRIDAGDRLAVAVRDPDRAAAHAHTERTGPDADPAEHAPRLGIDPHELLVPKRHDPDPTRTCGDAEWA